MKKIGLTMLVLMGVLAFAAATPSFVINGKSIKLETLEKNGKVYAEVLSFSKALGLKTTFDKSKNQFVIVAPSNSVAPVAGTTQLSGDAAELGKSYTLGKNYPLNFLLRSVEYSVTRVTVGTEVYAPNADQKLLILHFTVQNPLKQDQVFSYGDFRFTAVDSKDISYIFDSYVAREGTSELLDLNLKPTQKIDVVAVWAIPAVGSVPKLIVQRGEELSAPVLRFDLRNKIKPLVAPFVDANDASGSSALNEVPAKIGVYYPLKIFDVKLESIGFTGNAMYQTMPSEGKRYLVASFAIKNGTGASTAPSPYSSSAFGFILKDSDSEKTEFTGYLIKMTRDEIAEGSLKSGEEYRFKVYFEVGQSTTGQILYVSDRNSRVYAIDISSFK
jgi:hypothetical protein